MILYIYGPSMYTLSLGLARYFGWIDKLTEDDNFYFNITLKNVNRRGQPPMGESNMAENPEKRRFWPESLNDTKPKYLNE